MHTIDAAISPARKRTRVSIHALYKSIFMALPSLFRGRSLSMKLAARLQSGLASCEHARRCCPGCGSQPGTQCGLPHVLAQFLERESHAPLSDRERLPG